jgi:hypothetical protein
MVSAKRWVAALGSNALKLVCRFELWALDGDLRDWLARRSGVVLRLCIECGEAGFADQ